MEVNQLSASHFHPPFEKERSPPLRRLPLKYLSFYSTDVLSKGKARSGQELEEKRSYDSTTLYLEVTFLFLMKNLILRSEEMEEGKGEAAEHLCFLSRCFVCSSPS